MAIVMRITQQYDPAHEDEFLALEKQFADLEKNREGLPKGTRLQPVSAAEPNNTLIWQCEFPDMQSACRALDLFSGDAGHEELFRQQVKYIKQVNIHFYKKLDY